MNQYRIAVCGRKGGVGKTTTSACLASLLSDKGYRVLVIDLDPQTNTGFALGVDPIAPGTAELLLGQHPQPLQASSNLYVLPGGPNLQDHMIASADPEELGDAIESLPQNYDIVIFDCPPGTDYLERFGLVAANLALICTNAHPLGILGAQRVVADISRRAEKGRKGPSRWALVLTQINRSRTFDKELPEALKNQYPNVPQFVIGQNSELSWATAHGIPLMASQPNSKSVIDFEHITNWIFQDQTFDNQKTANA